MPPALGEASAKTDAIIVDVEVPTHALQGDLDEPKLWPSMFRDDEWGIGLPDI